MSFHGSAASGASSSYSNHAAAAAASSAAAAAAAAATANNEQPLAVEPKPLQLALDPENGSLLTAPLTHVLLTATDDLYSDLYNMAHGELNVVVTTGAAEAATDMEIAEDNNNNNNNTPAPATPAAAAAAAAAIIVPATKLERMSNLSFAQRRHELAWRLARHGKTLQHVAALTAAAATTDLSAVVQVSTAALQHARTAWVQADEAQDALYFFHAQLFPSRAAPHDVYGAADLMQQQQQPSAAAAVDAVTTTRGGAAWYDMCRDLQLLVDPYDTSLEASWSAQEVDERWQLAVRRKLVAGEVGWKMMQRQQQQQQQQQPVLWKVSLRGGLVRLTQGQGKRVVVNASSHDSSTATAATTATTTEDDYIYPIEALLTVIPSSQHHQQQQKQKQSPPPPEWTLLSLDVRVQPKTGEFNYQLETSNRQRYDLHRLASIAMSREEARARRAVQQQQQQQQQAQAKVKDENAMEIDNDNEESSPKTEEKDTMARPLRALFQVAHRFSLSWQLEVLSAQAQGLRRGVWAAAAGSNAINVMPVRFFDDSDDNDDDDDKNCILGVVSISFWKVDDAYGPPSLGDLSLQDGEEKQTNGNTATQQRHPLTDNKYRTESTSQLILSIRAEANAGLRVALSGASSILRTAATEPRARSTVEELLEAASNPFALSASDALLAATRLCADRKCYAVVQALQKSSILPSWIALSVEHGSIAIATRIKYYGIEMNASSSRAGSMPILFRLMCDARTGSFVPTFPRSLRLLRRLACNEIHASEPVAIRTASLPPNRRRAAGANTSGRCVRDAFAGLIRSMNALGYRTGVGGTWDDLDSQSSLLRHRAIQSACTDVKTSLVTCCAMSALFGLAPIAMASAVGLDATPDM